MGDLNALIIDQRDPLESTQRNVESGNANVEGATQELRKVHSSFFFEIHFDFGCVCFGIVFVSFAVRFKTKIEIYAVSLRNTATRYQQCKDKIK